MILKRVRQFKIWEWNSKLEFGKCYNDIPSHKFYLQKIASWNLTKIISFFNVSYKFFTFEKILDAFSLDIFVLASGEYSNLDYDFKFIALQLCLIVAPNYLFILLNEWLSSKKENVGENSIHSMFTNNTAMSIMFM